MKKTLAQKANHNFDDSNFKIYDENGNIIYYKDSTGFWSEHVFDANSNEIYYENSDGFWSEHVFDTNSKEIYFEDSTDYWNKN